MLSALSAIFTGTSGAPVNQLVTIGACEADTTVTLVIAIHVLTSRTMLAWICVTRVDHALTVGPFEPIKAVASVVIDAIPTNTSIHTGAERAVIVVCLAVGTTESWRTRTGERVDVVGAFGVIPTGIGEAVVFVNFTILTNKSWNTAAGVVARSIETSTAIQARRVDTIVRIHQTVAALETMLANTLIAAVGVTTHSVIATGRRRFTLVDIFVAVAASETNRTAAGEIVVVSIWAADSTVSARFPCTGVHLHFTSAAGMGRVANTFEPIDVVYTIAAVFAWSVPTVINIFFAVCACEASMTGTLVGCQQVGTRTAMLTRVSIALVYLFFTSRSLESWSTMADKFGYLVLTGAAILAGPVSTFVDVRLTALAIPSMRTPTHIVVHAIRALTAIETGPRQALVDILLAQSTSITWPTVAVETVDFVNTLTVVQTRVGRALVHINLALFAIGASWTVALEAGLCLLAHTSVLAGIEHAHIDLPVAEPARIAWCAPARETVDLVDTRSMLT